VFISTLRFFIKKATHQAWNININFRRKANETLLAKAVNNIAEMDLINTLAITK